MEGTGAMEPGPYPWPVLARIGVPGFDVPHPAACWPVTKGLLEDGVYPQ